MRLHFAEHNNNNISICAPYTMYNSFYDNVNTGWERRTSKAKKARKHKTDLQLLDFLQYTSVMSSLV